MSDDGHLNFEEHRRKREQGRELVPCPRCYKKILSTSIRCPECGVHFDGEVYDFVSTPSGILSRTHIIVLIVLLLLTLLLSMFGV